ncbi:MAG TPA: type III-A CRISPR-associated protein Cas10/Csm1 [Syntrophales bacterium]|nr:type III-A CRISPR-associated protein Cas10/Csm1 [Syntrophales bacterium]
MDDTVLKMAMAGLVHDIGKLAEDAMTVTDEFINNNCGLYQPFFNDRYTHRHAVHTAAFIDNIEKLLPAQFNRAAWGLEDTFINLAAGHHVPKTPMQWIIAMADRISSGWDRANFDKEYNEAIAPKDYKQTRLLPLFEKLTPTDSEKQTDPIQQQYVYPLKGLTPQSIFPQHREQEAPSSNEKALGEYKELFDQFIFALEKLLHRNDSIELWFEHFDSLMLICTSAIPAARAGKVVPDVSLYDHSRVTAALAAALYVYHRDTGSMGIDAIRDYSAEKFLLIGGDFYGIQDFISSDSGEAGRHRAKILRGRSFSVSLFSEFAADLICREIGISFSSIILNAAGKFMIIAPNTPAAKEATARAEKQINDWLIKVSFGQNSMGITQLAAKPDDFVKGRFADIRDSLNEKMAERKLQKIDLDRFGGAVDGYLDNFRNDLNPPLCPYCGKRPSSEGTKDRDDDGYCCRICHDHIFLGENLVKNKRIAITTADADLKSKTNRLKEPIFGFYQLMFQDDDSKLTQLARSGQLLKYWDISIDSQSGITRKVTAKFINGYVPVYAEDDLNDERLLAGKKSEQKKEERIDQLQLRTPKTFEHIANKAMNQMGGGYRGIEALGILKADVDQLGLLMSCGLAKEEITLSRIATLSRQLNFFFCLYLPHLLKTDDRFRDVYTVFAGGDDLFLIGPWNRMIVLVELLHNRFAAYTCGNKELHFSAGISLQKPHAPIDKMSEAAETALEMSKGFKDEGRNRVTIFAETVTWEDFISLQEIRKQLEGWQQENMVNSAMIYRLNDFINMAGQEKSLLASSPEGIHLEDMECLKWRALFRYSTERNIGRTIKGDENEKKRMKKEFSQTAQWLEEHGSSLRIALWDVIYNNR